MQRGEIMAVFTVNIVPAHAVVTTAAGKLGQDNDSIPYVDRPPVCDFHHFPHTLMADYCLILAGQPHLVFSAERRGMDFDHRPICFRLRIGQLVKCHLPLTGDCCLDHRNFSLLDKRSIRVGLPNYLK